MKRLFNYLKNKKTNLFSCCSFAVLLFWPLTFTNPGRRRKRGMKCHGNPPLNAHPKSEVGSAKSEGKYT